MLQVNATARAEPAESGPKERVTDKVNKDIMAQLVEMGFPEVRAEKGLWLTGEKREIPLGVNTRAGFADHFSSLDSVHIERSISARIMTHNSRDQVTTRWKKLSIGLQSMAMTLTLMFRSKSTRVLQRSCMHARCT